MTPWSKRLLIVAMLLWTAFTAGAGWYALRGNSTPAVAGPPPADAVKDAPLRTATTVVRALPEQATAQDSAIVTPETTAGALSASARGLRAAPAHAQNAGASSSIASVDPEGPRARANEARATAKGTIVLDPGHGRGDPGAVHYLPDGSGRWDMTEADSNLRNAELIRDDLQALGYVVYLTRNGEGQGPGGPLPLQFITSDLYARVGLANAVDADVYLAIHGNGATVKSISGPETWYCGRHEEAIANEKLAHAVQQAMMDALHEYGYSPPDRGVKEDAQSHHSGDFCQFVVTRETPVPAALLEFLFLSNDDDAPVLLDDRAHVLMAQHVAAALDAFMEERRG